MAGRGGRGDSEEMRDFGLVFGRVLVQILCVFCKNRSEMRARRLQNRPRRLPNQPRRLQNRPRGAPEGPKEAKTQSVAPILAVLRVTLGPRNGPKSKKTLGIISIWGHFGRLHWGGLWAGPGPALSPGRRPIFPPIDFSFPV